MGEGEQALVSPSPAARERGSGGEGSLRELALVLILSAALTLLLFVFATTRVGLQKDDAGQYYQLAQSPSALVRLPYTFRVLTPALAGLSPGDPIPGFILIALVALPLAATALYAYQRAVWLGWPAALSGAVLFTLSGGAIRMLTTPVYVDGITYLTEAAAFWLLAQRRFWPFLAVTTLGVLNRETALLPVVLYLLVEPPSRATWKRAAIAVLLPTFALGGVIVWKLSAGGILSGAVPLSVLAPFARTFRQDLPTLSELFDVYSTFGVLWLLGLRHLPGPTSFQRRALAYAALVVLQLTVSRGDEGRNLSHLFPVLIPLAMLDVQRTAGLGGRLGWVLTMLLVAGCALSLIHARWTILDSATLRYGLVAVGTALALLVAWGHRLIVSGSGRPAAINHTPTA